MAKANSSSPVIAVSSQPRRRKLFRWASLLMLVLFTGLYIVRPGITTAITIWPAWVWMFLGMGLATFALRPRRWLFALWLGFGIVFVEEFRSVPRSLLPEPTRDFRVVSLNCAGGSKLAAEEVKALEPDLVLFQESPSRSDLEKLARDLYGDSAVVAWGPDASILARGQLTPLPRPARVGNFVAARWEPSPGKRLDVVSLRLAPPVLRLDLFNPTAWHAYAEGREQRGIEMKEIRALLSQMGAQPNLIGGDFNTPPDAAIQSGLVGGMQDAFASAGVGLGATCVNPYPCIVRIDQIWAGSRVECVRSWVAKTEHSDHRMLVADYQWR